MISIDLISLISLLSTTFVTTWLSNGNVIEIRIVGHSLWNALRGSCNARIIVQFATWLRNAAHALLRRTEEALQQILRAQKILSAFFIWTLHFSDLSCIGLMTMRKFWLYVIIYWLVISLCMTLMCACIWPSQRETPGCLFVLHEHSGLQPCFSFSLEAPSSAKLHLPSSVYFPFLWRSRISYNGTWDMLLLMAFIANEIIFWMKNKS